jgi:chromate reductase
MRILGISGSLRAGSWNSALLRAAAELSPPGVELRVYGALKAIPPFDQDDETCAHAAVEGLRREIRDAGALLIATPEYNGSVPGQLKNALDWASRPVAQAALRRKPVAVIGASTSLFGAIWAQEELRRSLTVAGAVVLESSFAVAEAARRFDGAGRLADAGDRAELARVVEDLAELACPRAAAAAA